MFRETFVVAQLAKKFSAFMKPEDSLPCLQKPVTELYPVPV
jgi:hypothetical protein